jgi:hypothetical protein
MAATTEYPILPDYEELPPPQPIQQATADEASKEVLSAMVDLYEYSGGGAAALLGGGSHDDDFVMSFLIIAYYILRHERAQHYIAAQPQIGEELRRYTAYLLGTNGSIYWTLCDFDYMLKQLGA